MPAIRLILVNNAKQTQQAVVLIPADKLDVSAIEQAARSKLRLKKLVHIFDVSGQPVSELSSLQNGDKLILSQGEAFVGKQGTPASSSAPRTAPAPVRLIANKAEVTSEAVTQLNAVARLPGMVKVVGLPDLHAGQQSPIGAAYIAKDCVYPALVDQDIGCGMTLYATRLKGDTNPDKLAKDLDIDGPLAPGEAPQDLPSETLGTVDFAQYSQTLGSIGGGNHFAEFQTLEKLFLPDAFPAHIDKDHLFLLIHSGSRGLGKAILQAQPDGALTEGSSAFDTYITQHDVAVQWAQINRQIIADRLLACLGQDKDAKDQVLDLVHNCVVKIENEGWLHRKGAAPSMEEGQLGIIPGSRGHRTWMVRIKGSQHENAYSIAHGAGRAMTRTKAAQLAASRDNRKGVVSDLTRTSLDSVVICEDKKLIVEESPQVYKEVDDVVADLVEQGIVEIVASFKPVVTYKLRAQVRV